MLKRSFRLFSVLFLLVTTLCTSLVFAVDEQISVTDKLVFRSTDGQYKFRIGGRLHWDATFVGKDGDYNGESEHQIRRARLYLSGTTAQFWDFKLQVDFEDADDNSQAIEDAYVRYTGLPVQITVGQRKVPYSMNESTSSKYIAFVERSMASSLFSSEAIGLGGRAPGITLSYKWHDFFVDGGYYLLRQRSSDDSDIEERAIDDGNGLSGRVIWAQHDKQNNQLLHVGLSGGFRHYANESVARIRVRPNVSEGDRMVDTGGDLGADNYASFNLQLAGMYHRFWASGEYYHGAFDLTDDSETGDDAMDGYYIQAGYFLTDDNRRYKKGVWNSVRPKNAVGKGGIGAWEVAVRYDHIEMGAGLIENSEVDQSGDTVSVALNWYPINNLRLQANYITASCDDCAFTTGDPSFFVLRGQIFF